MSQPITKEDCALLSLIADIRAAVGDPTGKLMQDELVEHCRRLREDKERIEWLESQGGHIFDKGSGDFRFYWRKGDPTTVRQTLDKCIAQDKAIRLNAGASDTRTTEENTSTAPQGSGCPESPCYAEGDHVEVIDGSEAHGDRGRILYQQKNGIIVVELYSGACWPVEANEIRKLQNSDLSD